MLVIGGYGDEESEADARHRMGAIVWLLIGLVFGACCASAGLVWLAARLAAK
jgi:hypothetical protein